MARILFDGGGYPPADILRRRLEESGHAMIEADPVDGIRLENVLLDLPDILVIFDVVPRAGSTQLIETIKENPFTQRIPVFLVADSRGDEAAAGLVVDEFFPAEASAAWIESRIEARLKSARRSQQLEGQRNNYRSLLNINRRLASAIDPKIIAALVAEEMSRMIGIGRATILLADRGRAHGFNVASTSVSGAVEIVLPPSSFRRVHAAMASRGLSLCGEAVEAILLGELKHICQDDHLHSAAFVAIYYYDEGLGGLILHSASPEANFSENELEFAQAVANQAALSLKSAEFIKNLRERSDLSDSARRRAEEELKEKQRYEIFFQNAADGMVILDIRGQVSDVNRRFLEMTGYRRAEALGEPFSRFLALENVEHVLARIQRLLAGEVFEKFDLMILTKDGGLREGWAGAEILPGEDTGVILSIRDVTQERRLERELTRTTSFLTNVIDSSANAIVAADMKGAIILFNKAAEELLGYSAAWALANLNVRQLYPEGRAKEYMRLMRAPESNGKIHELQATGVHQSGDVFPINISSAVIYDQGREIATVGIFTDLRAKLKMERELEEARDKLMESSKQAAVVELAGATAHLLNQPLTTISVYCELLEKKLKETPEVSNCLEKINGEIDRIAAIVKQIGKITKYETQEYAAGSTRILDIDKATTE